MSFFISDALAEAAPAAAQDPGLAGLILPGAILLIFFFLFVLPQHRRGREHKKLVDSLAKGVEVVTNGGLLGKVVDVDDSFVQLEVGDNTIVNVQKHAISALMPKGTYKSRKKAEK
ncbi:preprotein translocase subunit YajC [Methylococcus sp. EFPC2]|uniref:preprotein translocase subunit YajC n=1 Tax=Methylococcus sp. EFPC2 TaxID=2812648 RepID=UPI0019686DB0|nr:preprotein translocase subunit YajC [Methylococcus sp. EFPC2]QSA95618.1 preprotein translocase subunit YajC [Methylococcus sp. EFPC2]